MAGGLPLGQLVVRCGVANEKDGDGSKANVSNQVLVITWLRPNLNTIVALNQEMLNKLFLFNKFNSLNLLKILT